MTPVDLELIEESCREFPEMTDDRIPELCAEVRSLRAEVGSLEERAEEAETRESSSVSARDLTIRDLLAEVARLRTGPITSEDWSARSAEAIAASYDSMPNVARAWTEHGTRPFLDGLDDAAWRDASGVYVVSDEALDLPRGGREFPTRAAADAALVAAGWMLVGGAEKEGA